MLEISLCGERLQLLPGRALYWPARRTLLIADPHFGKAGVFRRRGVPVPAGGTGDDLRRLTELLQSSKAERLLVLGDLVHAAPDADEPWVESLLDWRRAHEGLDVQVVAGNHDGGVATQAADWGMNWRDEPLPDGPFLFDHEPGEDAGAYVLAGHLHPVVRLRAGGDRLRTPVCWLRPRWGVLPSFGGFTGGHPVRPAKADRVYAMGDAAVVSLNGVTF